MFQILEYKLFLAEKLSQICCSKWMTPETVRSLMTRDKEIVSATSSIVLWPGTLVEGNKTINSYLYKVCTLLWQEWRI